MVREGSGNVGLIVNTWPLKAESLADARAEVDRRRWEVPGIAANGLEIIDDRGVVLARRPYLEGNVRVQWSYSSTP